ncbi:putative quinol monooxygenase [Thermodesulfobacteriota bacterium]
MWIRLIEVMIQPGKMDEARKIYNEQIVPIVKAQKGNIDVFVMESQDRAGLVVSFTSWETQKDGDSYESSGTYVQMVNKVKHTFADTPTLWSYEVKR